MKSQVTPSNLNNHAQPTNLKNKTSKKTKAKPFITPLVNESTALALRKQFDNSNPLYSKYIAMILNPLDNEVIGLPDASSARTCLYRSIRSFPVYADFGTGSSTARFSVAIQPKLGSLSSPSQYNVSMCQSVTSNSDFSNPSSYVGYTNGVDPRLDDNIYSLVGAKTGFWQLDTPSVSSIAPGLLQGTVSALSRNLDVDILDNAGVLNQIRIPGGTYVFTIYSTVSGPTVCNVVLTGGALVTGGNFGAFTANSSNIISGGWIINVTGASATLTITYSTLVNVTQSFRIIPVSVDTSSLFVQSTENLGNCKKIRPVATSALFSYAGTTLRDGGMISACLVPGDSLPDNFYTNNPINGGQYQDWENLARVPQAYNGPIREGSYTYWRPDSDLDSFLRTPDDANAYAFPSIVISGQYTPGENLSGLVQVGRLSVTHCYEWTTTSNLYEAYSRPGSHAVMDAITASINGYPTSMSNPIHLADIKRYLRGALDFIWKNRQALGTIATTAASLL